MSDSTTLGSVATAVTANFSSLSKLITSGSYLAGLGFSTASILKFKSHKDNPTQIPVGTSAALTAVSAALLFLPSVVSIAGSTTFDASSVKAAASGVTASDVEEAASKAGISSADASAAESAITEKLG
jgi:intracellular multiplication protein IcmD